MKKVAINPRKYYSTSEQNYTAGQEVVVEDSIAEELQEQGIATVIDDMVKESAQEVSEEEEGA